MPIPMFTLTLYSVLFAWTVALLYCFSPVLLAALVSVLFAVLVHKNL